MLKAAKMNRKRPQRLADPKDRGLPARRHGRQGGQPSQKKLVACQVYLRCCLPAMLAQQAGLRGHFVVKLRIEAW